MKTLTQRRKIALDFLIRELWQACHDGHLEEGSLVMELVLAAQRLEKGRRSIDYDDLTAGEQREQDEMAAEAERFERHCEP